MKRIAPNYYKYFRCIADRCRHSCCIGWEIDIDEDSLAYYEDLDSEFGRRIAQNIVAEGESAHFLLKGEEERCPFLKENGLCDMILTLGEDSLCDICREHPRFYHCFSDREEVGLGLCCEEAARLILSQKEDTVLEILDDDGKDEELTPWEKELISMRSTLFSLLQKREKNIRARACDMLNAARARFPEKSIVEWCDIFLSLEVLDPAWHETLGALRGFHGNMIEGLEKPFEKLLLYFIYRHTAEAQTEKDFSARVALAYLGYHMLRLLCSVKAEQGGFELQELCELARRYSSEIEYSEENTQILLDILNEYQ